MVDAADATGVPIGRDRNLRIEPHKLAGEERDLAALSQLLTLRTGNFGSMIENAVECAVSF